MKPRDRRWMAASVALACVLLASGTGHARTLKEKKQAAAAQFDKAERMKEALEGKAEYRRTRRDFQQVLDAYRKVYYTAPNSHRADASALAVAELLQEQDRPTGSKAGQDAERRVCRASPRSWCGAGACRAPRPAIAHQSPPLVHARLHAGGD